MIDGIEGAAEFGIGGRDMGLGKADAGTKDTAIEIREEQGCTEAKIGNGIAVCFRDSLNQTVKP